MHPKWFGWAIPCLGLLIGLAAADETSFQQPTWGTIVAAPDRPGVFLATVQNSPANGVLPIPVPAPHITICEREAGKVGSFEFNGDATQLDLHGLGDAKQFTLQTAEKTQQFDDGRIVLHAADAKVTGTSAKLEHHQGNDRIGFWTNADDKVSWKYEASRWGKYRVRLTYSTASPDGTEIFVALGQHKLEGKLTSTGSWYRYTTIDLGEVYFATAGAIDVSVGCTKLVGPAVMNLKAITLEPASEGTPPVQSSNGEIVLHSRDATVHGTILRYEPDPKKITLGYWAKASDGASWTFTCNKPGTFDVEVLQGCGAGQGGSDVALTFGKQELSFVVEDTGHFQNFKPRTIGQFKIDEPGTYKLAVKPKKIAKGAALDLRQVRLVPLDANKHGMYFKVSYPPNPDGLKYSVDYHLWLPEGVKHVRGVIVHQHGCGAGACAGGETAAYDLHWQALAKKWDCALLGPRYHQQDKEDCRDWCDARRGSAKAFLQGLDDLAKQTGHPELATAPWCLWGHSGGGFWSSIMQTLYPERIVAIWFRSGTAFEVWERGEIPKPEIPEAAYQIPAMLNPGIGERDEARFRSAWTGATSMFAAYRKKGAPIGLAPDPHSSHDCGVSRFAAIPFFDVCLAARLPAVGQPNHALQAMPAKDAYLAKEFGQEAVPIGQYEGDRETAIWLPNAAFAKCWTKYVTDGSIVDDTPPPSPTDVVVAVDGMKRILTWRAEADFESGIQAFVILRNGQEVGRVPKAPDDGRYTRKAFQSISYHDTPVGPLVDLKFVDDIAENEKPVYEVISVNAAGLKSQPATSK